MSGHGSLSWLGLVKDRRWPTLHHKVIMFVLADYVDEHDSCFPSQVTIAAEAQCSERKVRDVLADLERTGIITRQARPQPTGRGRTSDRIILVWKAANDLPACRAGKSESETTNRHETTGPTGTLVPGKYPEEVPSFKTLAPPSVTPPVSSKKPQPRNLIFDALVQAWGVQPKTKAETGRIVAAMKQIKDAEPDHPDDGIAREILRRARRYRETWPNAECTPTALAANWSRFSLDNFRKLESVRG